MAGSGRWCATALPAVSASEGARRKATAGARFGVMTCVLPVRSRDDLPAAQGVVRHVNTAAESPTRMGWSRGCGVTRLHDLAFRRRRIGARGQ
jgi:hypothetical protein